MHYLHTASRRIIDLLVEEGIGTLIIGKNPFWKQEVELGRKHNQEFVQIPHAKFIEMLTYKAELVGITLLLTEESSTSRASFLDRDVLPKRRVTFCCVRTQPHSGKVSKAASYLLPKGEGEQ